MENKMNKKPFKEDLKLLEGQWHFLEYEPYLCKAAPPLVSHMRLTFKNYMSTPDYKAFRVEYRENSGPNSN